MKTAFNGEVLGRFSNLLTRCAASMDDQSGEVLRAFDEDPVRYCSSGTTGEARQYMATWSSLVAKASSSISANSIVLLGFPVRTYAGLQVLAYIRRHRCQWLAPALRDLHSYTDRATHLSSTPTIVQQLLIRGADLSTLKQITLGGEYARQPLLDSLRISAPQARVTQIYASSEHGVCASWSDGQEGIPLERWNMQHAVDSDIWDLRNGRLYFCGRQHDLVNIAGQTVNMREVESILRSVDGVLHARIFVRPSPLTGHVLLAELVGTVDRAKIDAALSALPTHARPKYIAKVDHIAMAESGKQAR